MNPFFFEVSAQESSTVEKTKSIAVQCDYLNCGCAQLIEQFENIYLALLWLTGFTLFLVIVYVGAIFAFNAILAGDLSAKVAKAKSIMRTTLIGIVLVLGAYLIVDFFLGVFGVNTTDLTSKICGELPSAPQSNATEESDVSSSRRPNTNSPQLAATEQNIQTARVNQTNIELNLLFDSENVQYRGCDDYGCGAYGSSRDFGNRTAKGDDILARPGTQVYAPADGVIIETERPAYSDLPSYNIITMEMNDATRLRFLYVSPNQNLSDGQSVEKGIPLGTVEDLRQRYPGIPTHIELQMLTAEGTPVSIREFLET